MNPIKPSCVFCQHGLPHERHVTLVEHARLFGEAETYANDLVLVKSAGDVVVTGERKQRIA